MRGSRGVVAGGVLLSLALSGCAAIQNREWGTCALAGGIVGAIVGGTAGGVAVNNTHDHPANAERGGAIGGGIVGGGAIGALVGHLICDPEKTTPPPPPPPPPPAPKKIVTLEGANFDFNKSTLKPEGKKKLDVAVKAMKDDPSLHVTIEGHTDSVGSPAYNQKLSERRADSAKAYIVSQGGDGKRISTIGFGETKPIADNNTDEGRAQNRRVDVLAK